MTWSQVEGKVPDCTLGRWMDEVEEATGKWPEWSDQVPDYIEKEFPVKQSSLRSHGRAEHR